MLDVVVRHVDRHGVHGELGAVFEGVEAELCESVELELEFLEVVQVDEGAGLDVGDPGGETFRIIEGFRLGFSCIIQCELVNANFYYLNTLVYLV